MRKDIPPTKGQLVTTIIIGITGVSLAAVWIRLAMDTAAPANRVGFSLMIAALRLTIASAVLLPTWRSFKLRDIRPQALGYGIAAGVCLAVHFATWITSLAYTSIASSTVLVTTNPLWVGLLAWWWYGEQLRRTQVVAIILACLGGIIMAIADLNLGGDYSNPLLGDALALAGGMMSSLYIIFGSQAQRRGLATTNYIAIAYSVGALCLLPWPWLMGTKYGGHSGEVYLYVLLMALFSQVIGHSSLNWSVRWISPTLISLILLLEPVVASLAGAIVLQEIPPLETLAGGVIILLGITLFLRRESHKPLG